MSLISEEENFNSQHYRGSLALTGVAIQGIASKWSQRFAADEKFQAAQRGRHDRDGDMYHMTILTPKECKGVTSLGDFSLHGLELFDLGVGVKDGCYFVIVLAPKLQKFRKTIGLGPTDLHITLGFLSSDVHGIRKDFGCLLPCPQHTVEFCESAERLLRAPSSANGRAYFQYSSIAEHAMYHGFLFGAYYYAKLTIGAAVDACATHDFLEERIQQPLTCKRLDNEAMNYGDLVCEVLNCNIYTKTSHFRQRRFYSCKIHVETHPSYYNITVNELPRNFGFVTDTLAGSSVLEYRHYFECMVPIGITDVITVMEDPLRPSLYANLPLRYHFLKVDDRTPPTMDQMRHIIQIFDAAGKVVVHCQGGVGRTATVLAAILMWTQGMTRSEAKRPLEYRKTIISESQDTFLSDWYHEVEQARSIVDASEHHHISNHAPKEKLPPILMCIGFPSSGKSAFAESLAASFGSHITRVSQDELGRRECEKMMESLSKRSGHTVILDRCNLSKEERREWLDMARHKRVWAITFTAPIEECKWRIIRRVGHPTIKKGSGERIIDAMAGNFDMPDLNEGFDKIIQVPSFDACNMLLKSWGCEVVPESTIPPEEGIIKFPRTRHVQNLGAATRDDLVMTAQEVEMTFLHHELFVEEKIDGANMGISIRNNILCAQNRSHFVSSTYHSQFKFLDKWMAKHADDLWKILESDRYVLYGEWVYAKHSILYKDLPDWFVAFDYYDKLERKFWSRPRLEKLLEGTSIQLIPLIARSTFNSAEQLRALAQTPSQFYSGPVEGVYLRRCNDSMWLTERGKIVRSDFMSGNDFWTKGGIQPNSKKTSAEYNY